MKLNQKFDLAQSKGMQVSFSWLYTKANIIHKETDKDAKCLSPSVTVSFLRKCSIKFRRAQGTNRENTEAPVQRCSVKKVFLEIS